MKRVLELTASSGRLDYRIVNASDGTTVAVGGITGIGTTAAQVSHRVTAPGLGITGDGPAPTVQDVTNLHHPEILDVTSALRELITATERDGPEDVAESLRVIAHQVSARGRAGAPLPTPAAPSRISAILERPGVAAHEDIIAAVLAAQDVFPTVPQVVVFGPAEGHPENAAERARLALATVAPKSQAKPVS